MKSTAILMTAVLLMGLILSMGFTLADSERGEKNREGKGITGNVIARANADQKAISMKDIGHDDDLEDEFDVEDANKEIDDSVEREARESTFAQVSIGQGWATSSEEGFFARIFWVEKTFVNEGTNASNQTNSTPANETTKAIGTLKIGSDLYRLTLDSQTNDSMVFDVMSEKGKINGTLELEAGTSLLGFTVWSGTLDLESGKSYDINLATKNSKVKGSKEVKAEIKSADKESGLKGNLNAETRGEGKKLGLFERIKAFFRGE